MILCIDPGVHACGLAWFSLNWELLRAHYRPIEKAFDEPAYAACEVWIEMPRIYPGAGQQKGDLNDLLDLAAVVGKAEGLYNGGGEPYRVFPSRWKGQVPKKIMTARILAALKPLELQRIERIGAKDHNTIDAIGIGLWAGKRL